MLPSLERRDFGRRGARAQAPEPAAAPMRSLSSRLVAAVFVAVLVASGIAAWVSVQSIRSVIRGELEQRLASVLRDTGGRLERVVSHDAGYLEGAGAEVLRRAVRGSSTRLTVVADSGDVLLGSDAPVPGQPGPEQPGRRGPLPGASPGVQEYDDARGVRVLGSSLRLPQLGWTLIAEEPCEAAYAPVARAVRRILALELAFVVAFTAISLHWAYHATRPILALVDGARRIAGGETGVVIPSTSGDPLGLLTLTFNQMTARLHDSQSQLEQSRREAESANEQIVARNQQLQRANEALKQLSITDHLTRLHNHRFFQDHLPREMKRASRTGEPLALVLIDLDDFKRLNDHWGHAVGDAVLRRAAQVMNDNVREMDLLARYGGEEFALLASGTSLPGALALAEKVRLAVSEARFPVVDLDGPQVLKVTVSIGVAAFRGDERAFFNDADRALYRAKENGKDCVVAADTAAGAQADPADPQHRA